MTDRVISARDLMIQIMLYQGLANNEKSALIADKECIKSIESFRDQIWNKALEDGRNDGLEEAAKATEHTVNGGVCNVYGSPYLAEKIRNLKTSKEGINPPATNKEQSV